MNANVRFSIAMQIAEARAAKGMSLRQLEAASGVGRNNLNAIEHGLLNVGIDNLGRIAKALGVKLTVG